VQKSSGFKIKPEEAGDLNDRDTLGGFEEEMRRIREATGVHDTNEIIQKFSTQQDTFLNLQELKHTNEQKFAEAQKAKQQLKEDIERAKYEGSEAMTRKQLDEADKHVQAAQTDYDRA